MISTLTSLYGSIRNTEGVAGWPDITSALFDKIDQCEVFVADITPINGPDSDFRITPNPNVLLELGYALGHRIREDSHHLRDQQALPP